MEQNWTFVNHVVSVGRELPDRSVQFLYPKVQGSHCGDEGRPVDSAWRFRIGRYVEKGFENVVVISVNLVNGYGVRLMGQRSNLIFVPLLVDCSSPSLVLGIGDGSLVGGTCDLLARVVGGQGEWSVLIVCAAWCML